MFEPVVGPVLRPVCLVAKSFAVDARLLQAHADKQCSVAGQLAQGSPIRGGRRSNNHDRANRGALRNAADEKKPPLYCATKEVVVFS